VLRRNRSPFSSFLSPLVSGAERGTSMATFATGAVEETRDVSAEELEEILAHPTDPPVSLASLRVMGYAPLPCESPSALSRST
jgi:hypothetical protein